MFRIFRFNDFESVNESRAFTHFDPDYAEEHMQTLREFDVHIPDAIPDNIREWEIWIEQLDRIQRLVNGANAGDVLSILPEITDENKEALVDLKSTHHALHQFIIDGTLPLTKDLTVLDRTELKHYKKSILELVFDYSKTSGSFDGEWESVLTDAGLNLRAIWPAITKVYNVLCANLVAQFKNKLSDSDLTK